MAQGPDERGKVCLEERGSLQGTVVMVCKMQSGSMQPVGNGGHFFGGTAEVMVGQ